jgi:hypothetical protein
VCVKFCKLLSDDMWSWHDSSGGREWAINSSSEAAAGYPQVQSLLAETNTSFLDTILVQVP